MDKDSRHHDEPEDDFTPPPIPAAPDGGIPASIAAGALGQPTTVPARTPDNFVCLRGPCRHYWHLVTMAQEGNPAETWEHLGIPAPRQHHHTCLVNPGFETGFGDDNAYECNKWDPLDDAELVQIKVRRGAYYQRHPEHRPVTHEDIEEAEDA